MTLRLAKIALIFGIAIYYTIVVLNNLADYDSNLQVVRHVLLMDTTFPGNRGMWRALRNPRWQVAFYLAIIVWEVLTGFLCWWGGYRLARAVRSSAASFRQAARMAVAALASGLLMWLVAFLAVGGEWFLMWQSTTWNGQAAAFRMFTVLGIVLLIVVQPEPHEQL